MTPELKAAIIEYQAAKRACKERNDYKSASRFVKAINLVGELIAIEPMEVEDV